MSPRLPITKNRSLIVLISTMLLVLPLAGCTFPGFGSSSIQVPSLEDNFEAVYEPPRPINHPMAAEDPTFTYTSQGKTSQFYDGFTGESEECLVTMSKNEFDQEDFLCNSLYTGDLMGREFIIEETTALGRKWPKSHDAMPMFHFNLMPAMFQGQTFEKGEKFTVYFTGAELNFQVSRVKGTTAIFESRTVLYDLEPDDATPVMGNWVKDTWVQKYVIDTSVGPFATEIWSGDTLIWQLRDFTMDGEELAPFDLPESLSECIPCDWVDRGKTPQVSGFDDFWDLDDALKVALRDTGINDHFNKNEHVVITQAHYANGQYREEILGPVGTDHRAQSWEFRIDDPVEGRGVRVEVEWIEDRDPTIKDTSWFDSNYSLAITMWPAMMADPGSWWSWILKGDSEIWVEELRFNVPLDSQSFGNPDQLWVWTADPETMEGMDPSRFSWEIVVAYPNGGAELFSISAVNGQLLSIPGRYIEETM